MSTRNLFVLFGCIAVLAATCGSVSAASIAITNADFEQGPVNTSTPTGWTLVSDWTWVEGGAGTNGSIAFDANVKSNQVGNPAGSISQTLSSVYAAGTYVLSADMRTADGTPSFTLELRDADNGYATLATATVALASDWANYNVALNVASTDTFIGHKIDILLAHGTAAIGNTRTDNVALNFTPVPEPSTIAMLGIGLFGLLCYAWRRRK